MQLVSFVGDRDSTELSGCNPRTCIANASSEECAITCLTGDLLWSFGCYLPLIFMNGLDLEIGFVIVTIGLCWDKSESDYTGNPEIEEVVEAVLTERSISQCTLHHRRP